MRNTLAAVLLIGFCAPCPWGAAADPPDEEAEDLRERLTEREDKRRPERSRSVLIDGRPLVISGEYELASAFVRRRVIGGSVPQRDRLVLENGLEVEGFYSFGPALSLFGQLRLTSQEDLLQDVRGEVSDLYLEPGEIWLYSEDVADSGLDLDVGRLDFEDERRWWWDDEIEGARLAFEGEEVEASLALARPLLPDRSDQSFIDPEEDRVSRVIAHASWDWRPNHGLGLFALHQDDRSSTERIGAIVRSEREDESDARLRWLGARALGVLDLRPQATLGYWLDTAWLRGDERFIEYDDENPLLPPRRSEVTSVTRRDVRGFAYDAGVSVGLASVVASPRLFGGCSRATHHFRQPGIESNEAGFGGVERFRHYGELLDPDLSNLGVLTLGVGLSLLRSSSLDLVYHRYRLRHRTGAQPGIELVIEDDFEPRHADLGQELDLVLALEEWERVEFELVLATFRAGGAFERHARGETSLGAAFAVRFAF
jgi:hypothetical protein